MATESKRRRRQSESWRGVNINRAWREMRGRVPQRRRHWRRRRSRRGDARPWMANILKPVVDKNVWVFVLNDLSGRCVTDEGCRMHDGRCRIFLLPPFDRSLSGQRVFRNGDRRPTLVGRNSYRAEFYPVFPVFFTGFSGSPPLISKFFLVLSNLYRVLGSWENWVVLKRESWLMRWSSVLSSLTGFNRI